MRHAGHAFEAASTTCNSCQARLAPITVARGGPEPGTELPADALFDLDLAQAVLDHLNFGVALFGKGTRLLFINRAAQNECARFPGLRVEGDTLVLDEPARNEFLRALRSAREGVWSFVQLARQGQRLVLGLRPARPSGALGDTPVLVTFGIRDPSDQLSIHFFARACGLSPTEADVVRRLSEGLSPKEIAHQHDVALSTVRTQLRCVRTKTGARNITELVRTMGCLPPMMPVEGSLPRRGASQAIGLDGLALSSN